MHWTQKQLTLPAYSSGVHPITREILQAVPELRKIRTGMMNLFLQHTSASISINENADPDVPGDLDMALDKIAPESFPYRHTLEGRDDMPAHVKSSMIGTSLNIPVSAGRLLLGTWQGIYLCEHRRSKHRRVLVITIFGEQDE